MTLRISGGRKLQSPPGRATRPTTSRVRLAAMNLLAAELPDSRWLDLCCGCGVMACEALQRGASMVVAVEQDRRIASVARANLDSVRSGLDRPVTTSVHTSEVLQWLGQGCREEPFDLIYVDPPYAAGLYSAITAGIAKGKWLKTEGTLVWECSTTASPSLPDGWDLLRQRRYGMAQLMLLQQQAANENARA